MFVLGPIVWIFIGIAAISAQFKIGGLVLTLVNALFEALSDFIKGLLGRS